MWLHSYIHIIIAIYIFLQPNIIMSVCVLHFSKNQNWNSKSVTFLQKKKQNEIFAKKKLEVGNWKSEIRLKILDAHC